MSDLGTQKGAFCLPVFMKRKLFAAASANTLVQYAQIVDQTNVESVQMFGVGSLPTQLQICKR